MDLQSLERCSAIIALASTRKAVLVFKCIEEDKITVTRMGIDINDWDKINRENARRTLGILHDEFAILVPGKSWRKGTFDVLESALRLDVKDKDVGIIILNKNHRGRG